MFEQVQFPTSRPQMHQASVIQQQAPQQGGGGGGLLGSLFGMGLNMLMPGMGSLATGLISGNPRQAVGGVAEMAGLSGGGGDVSSGGNVPGQSPTQPSPSSNKPTGSTSGEGEGDSSSNSSPSPEQQKIESDGTQQGSPNGSMQDPSSQLQQLLAMMYLQQMFQGQNPSMFPMPQNPVMGMNPAARSPINGMPVM